MRFLALALLAALTVPSSAQPQDVPVPAPPGPILVTEVDVRLFVDGPAMGVETRLALHNPDTVERDFELFYPLGDGSLVSGFAIVADGRELPGEILDAARARDAFRRMAEARRDPALLEHYGEAAWRARLAVPAAATREIVLSYTRLVEPDGENLGLHLPLSAFRRSGAPLSLSIRGEIRSRHPVGTLYSPTHAVREVERWTTWDDDSRAFHHTSFAVDRTAFAVDTDFQAFYQARPAGARFDVTVLSERPDPAEDGWFLAVIHGVPDETLQPEPKNVVFVLDTSGSMKERKIEQAREALKYLVGRLRPEDRFNLVTYADEVAVWADRLQGPTPNAVQEVEELLDGVVAEGSTNISGALLTALEQFHDAEHLNQIVFVTDGLATAGEQDTAKIRALVREANAHETRIVAFGLGFDVDGAFLDRLAAENRGMAEYVLPDEDIAEKVPGFYERMHAPLLLDTQIELAGAVIHDVHPAAVGDLYGGHQVVLTGRYTQPGDVTVRISGRRGEAQELHELPATLRASSDPAESELVGRIWAAKKIGFLVDEIRLEGETEERVEAIVELGTRFGILTEYTAFLAGEDVDLWALEANKTRCSLEIAGRAGVVTGAHGVAQACNSKALQRNDQVTASNSWIDENGDRITVGGVQCVAGKAFFRREGAWQDSATGGAEVDRVVALYSEPFFELLDEHPWLGRCVARTGEVTVEVGGRVVRITG